MCWQYSVVFAVRRTKLFMLGLTVMRHIAVAATEQLCAVADQAAELHKLAVLFGQQYVLPLRHMAGLTLTVIAIFFRLPPDFGTLCGLPENSAARRMSLLPQIMRACVAVAAMTEKGTVQPARFLKELIGALRVLFPLTCFFC